MKSYPHFAQRSHNGGFVKLAMNSMEISIRRLCVSHFGQTLGIFSTNVLPQYVQYTSPS